MTTNHECEKEKRGMNICVYIYTYIYMCVYMKDKRKSIAHHCIITTHARLLLLLFFYACVYTRKFTYSKLWQIEYGSRGSFFAFTSGNKYIYMYIQKGIIQIHTYIIHTLRKRKKIFFLLKKKTKFIILN